MKGENRKRLGRSIQGEGKSPFLLGWAGEWGGGRQWGPPGLAPPSPGRSGQGLGKVRGHSSTCTEPRVSLLSEHIPGSLPTPQGCLRPVDPAPFLLPLCVCESLQGSGATQSLSLPGCVSVFVGVS